MTSDKRPGIAARALTGLVKAYQAIRFGRPSPCRFVPSCSTYAVEAIEAHGAGRGAWLAVRRVVRCNPWGGQGFDPVPTPRKSNSHPHHHHERTVA